MTQTGLPVVTLGGPPRPTAADELLGVNYSQPPWAVDWPVRPELLTADQVGLLEVLGRYTIAVAEGIADDLVAFAEQWRPELIVHDTLALSAAVAAARLGVPCVRLTHGTQDVFRMAYRVTGDEPLPEYAAMFGRFGADLPAGPPLYVDTMPPSMYIGAERPCFEMRYVPYNGAGQLPDELTGARARPRICVTWGVTLPSMFGEAAVDPYRDAITAMAASGAEVLVLVTEKDRAALGAPPLGVRYLAGAPLNLVLPYCDAIMHHGGDGTAMTAACLAVPQVIIPREPVDDQMTGRFTQAGVAIHLVHQQLEAGGQIRDAVGKLLAEPGYAEAAGRLRDEIERQPAPADVVAELAALSAG